MNDTLRKKTLDKLSWLRMWPRYPSDPHYQEIFDIPPGTEETHYGEDGGRSDPDSGPNLRIGVDFDGVVTRYPEMLSYVMKKFEPINVKFFLITARSEDDSFEVNQYLKSKGLKFFNVIFYSYDKSNNSQMYRMLDVAKWKATEVKKNDIDIFIDDDPVIILMIKKYCPEALSLLL